MLELGTGLKTPSTRQTCVPAAKAMGLAEVMVTPPDGMCCARASQGMGSAAQLPKLQLMSTVVASAGRVIGFIGTLGKSRKMLLVKVDVGQPSELSPLI
jgi:hypothetical protein